MKVTCNATTGDKLPGKYFEHGYSRSSSFDLVSGNEYIVYGISLWLGFVLYLVVGEGRRPHWYPADLFEVTSKRLPSCWYFEFLGSKELFELQAVFGYEELIYQDEHFDQLSNLEDLALQIFETRRIEIEACLDE